MLHRAGGVAARRAVRRLPQRAVEPSAASNKESPLIETYRASVRIGRALYRRAGRALRVPAPWSGSGTRAESPEDPHVLQARHRQLRIHVETPLGHRKANPKDTVEQVLNHATCAGLVILATAQTALNHSWPTAVTDAGLQLANGRVCLRVAPARCTRA